MTHDEIEIAGPKTALDLPRGDIVSLTSRYEALGHAELQLPGHDCFEQERGKRPPKRAIVAGVSYHPQSGWLEESP